MDYLTSMKQYDVTIIGAGCSGLSLAYRLIGSPLKVCVLDNTKRDNRYRKTWSYWNTYEHPFQHLQAHSNSSLVVKNSSQTILDCSNYNYSTIDSYDFDNFIFEELENSKNVDVVFETNIEDIHLSDDGYSQIISDNETRKTSYVFDSRPSNSFSTMKQVFKGLFVEFRHPLKDFQAHLMDFSEKNQFHFFYSLPLGEGKYLFESTYYTSLEMDKESMASEVHDYIVERYGEDYSVIREEYGEIPLTTNTKLNNKKSNYIKIGIPAGSTRASTGYTFLNIQKQADEYMKMLNGKAFIEHPKTFKNKLLRKMDNLLLMIIKDHPIESKNILFEMFNRNQAQRIIRFLSDTPSLLDIILIIWNMPKLLFIKYAIRSFTTPKI